MKDWGERLQELLKKERKVDKLFKEYKPKGYFNIDSKLPNKKRDIPMPKVESIRIYEDHTVLLEKLLNNPRVESITISHQRVGEVEQTDIKAKLKEMNENDK